MILPNQDRIVFRRIEIERKSEGGIILAASEVGDTDVAYGQVLFLGEGKLAPETGKLIPMRARVGDVIVFNPRMPSRWIYGQEMWIIRDSDVFAYLRDENIQTKEFTDIAHELRGRPMVAVQ